MQKWDGGMNCETSMKKPKCWTTDEGECKLSDQSVVSIVTTARGSEDLDSSLTVVSKHWLNKEWAVKVFWRMFSVAEKMILL
jgi:hypothetical protein